MPQLCVVLFAKWLGILSALLDAAAPLHTMCRCPYWSSTAGASYLSLCQVRSHGLMEALCRVIGRSIRHSALGTLAALIRSLGLLTSQGWMLKQNTDQMTVPCFVGACKGGGRRQRKSIC